MCLVAGGRVVGADPWVSLAALRKRSACARAVPRPRSVFAKAQHVDCDFLLKYFDVRQKARAEEMDAITDAKAARAGVEGGWRWACGVWRPIELGKDFGDMIRLSCIRADSQQPPRKTGLLEVVACWPSLHRPMGIAWPYPLA